MTKENTPRSKASQANCPPITQDRLRGVPLDLVCRVEVFKAELGIKDETWTMYVNAGLPVIPVGRGAIVVVSKAVAFIEAKPKLGNRPSAVRKQRHLKRKERTP